MTKAFVKYITLVVLTTLVLAGFVEAAARVLITAQTDWKRISRSNWKVISPTLGWKARPGYKGWAAREYREFNAQGHVVREREKNVENKRKVLLIGDSCSYGLRVSSEATFGALLEKKLRGVEVSNRAIPGYSSYQGVEVLKDSLSMKPDMIVASFSFNDRRAVLNKNHQDSHELFSYYDQWSWMLKVRTYSYFLGWIHGRTSKIVDLRNASVRVPSAQYRENLGKIADLAKVNKIPLVFIIMQDNPNYMALAKRGIKLRNQGKLRDAAKAFHEAIVLKPLIADLPKLLLANTLEELGEPKKAARIAKIRAIFPYDGGGPLRIDSQYAQAMLEVGQRDGVYVFDARSLLSKNSSVFFDVVHFDEMGHKIIAQGLFEFLSKHKLLDTQETVVNRRVNIIMSAEKILAHMFA